MAWVKRVRWRIHPSGRTVGGQPWIGHSKLCSAVRWLQTFSLRKRRQLWPGLSCMCLQCSLFKRPLSVFFVFFLWKQTTCDDGSVYQPYQAASEYGIGSDVGTIQLEIYENGPVAVGFLVCRSFENFFSANPTGVLTTDCGSGSTDLLGGHAVTLIGYQALTFSKISSHDNLSQLGHSQWSGLLVTRQPMEHLLG